MTQYSTENGELPEISSGATGSGFATITDQGEMLEAWFRAPVLAADVLAAATVTLSEAETVAEFGEAALQALRGDRLRSVRRVAIRTRIDDLRKPPVDVADIYLRLQLLSHRLVQPRALNLEGMAAILPDIAWTSRGPCLVGQVEAAQWTARLEGIGFDIRSVFKIPRMVDYVVPPGVSISNTDRVWLGAYLSPGTILTAEGFCGFNAGTLGRAMVEGRISAGVIVGEGTDIGGGASIMGTISGGGKQVIRIGRESLLGANSGTGISLGDHCVVEAGCYVTAGAPVTLESGAVVKAATLSGQSNMLFRRNARTGRLEALENKKAWGSLNAALHAEPAGG
jgi:2,3,4,5-tetrahydropyridine-2-carboxylate N-succinyltransferase